MKEKVEKVHDQNIVFNKLGVLKFNLLFHMFLFHTPVDQVCISQTY